MPRTLGQTYEATDPADGAATSRCSKPRPKCGLLLPHECDGRGLADLVMLLGEETGPAAGMGARPLASSHALAAVIIGRVAARS